MFEHHELAPGPQRFLAHTLRFACRATRLGDGEVTAVELVAGRAYTLQFVECIVRYGTPRYPSCVAIYEAAGTLLAGAMNGSGENCRNGRLTFTASRSGIHYVVTVGHRDHLASFKFSLVEAALLATPAEPEAESAFSGGANLGDITALDASGVPIAHFHGAGKGIAVVRFTLTEVRRICLALRLPDTEAELGLEDAGGTVLCRRKFADASGEWVSSTLNPGTYGVRVEMPDDTNRTFALRYRACAAEAIPVAARGVSLGAIPVGEQGTDWLRYRLVGGTDTGFFELDERTGELFFNGSEEDFQDGLVKFKLTVRASDRERSVDQTVVVSAAAVPESPAYGADAVSDYLSLADYCTRISLGTVFDRAPVDIPLRYCLIGGNEAGLFELDEATGELFFNGSAEDFELIRDRFRLSVRTKNHRQ
ncbi:MAG: cadherin repeat domain-containing protein [Proteobacteria bacterium]|nr:cadherin repeat domain-containing protein [Pseudomonadota bacterium]MYJ94680.1 cadherin repeat domain-containing protein [Pseudomonadota bacterium]